MFKYILNLVKEMCQVRLKKIYFIYKNCGRNIQIFRTIQILMKC